MLKIFQTLKPNLDAPALNANGDKPSILGFYVMNKTYPHENLTDETLSVTINGELITEKWVPIVGFEDCYDISSFGRIRSHDRLIWNGVGYIRVFGRILKPSVERDNYLHVRLSKNGGYKNKKIHRLVAFAFVKNEEPEVNDIVNHLDCDRLNNMVCNLAWTTIVGNNLHAKINGRLKNNGKNLIHNNQLARKPLSQICVQTGELVKEWSHLGGVPSTIISRSALWRALNGKTRAGAKGYYWKYKQES